MLEPAPGLFQYHSGPIKRVRGGISSSGSRTCFNTTLVQLKDEIRRQREASLDGFNTTLVQLKESLHLRSHCCASSFNTTLVQLKATRTAPPLAPTCTFQYHSGPIKSAVRIFFTSFL